ncbi:unnamed protein product [Parnassius mnemosyne]|uniref:NADH-ubiquinone oxidoreductase MNLL subunit n=1 Tax=Parnassius mnemosyne TaxID=213953 RepID=A0AAV1L0V0_9NEOP
MRILSLKSSLKIKKVYGDWQVHTSQLLPITGFFIGKFLDDQETLRMTNFRDKSCLYGGNVKEGDPPSWP